MGDIGDMFTLSFARFVNWYFLIVYDAFSVLVVKSWNKALCKSWAGYLSKFADVLWPSNWRSKPIQLCLTLKRKMSMDVSAESCNIVEISLSCAVQLIQLRLGKWHKPRWRLVELTILCTFWRASGGRWRQAELGEFGPMCGRPQLTERRWLPVKTADMNHEIGWLLSCSKVPEIDMIKWMILMISDLRNLPRIIVFQLKKGYKVSWANPRCAPQKLPRDGLKGPSLLSLLGRSFKIKMLLSWPFMILFFWNSHRKCSKRMAKCFDPWLVWLASSRWSPMTCQTQPQHRWAGWGEVKQIK